MPPKEVNANDATGARILVVDDEPNIVDVITMALKFQGFEVESADNGIDAIKAVHTFKPHLMLLDIMLPDIEGFEVAERLGATRGRTPIIFLDRPRLDRGQGPRPDDRRRRLHHQAVQPRRAGRPHSPDPASHRPGRRRRRGPPDVSKTSSSTRPLARSRAAAATSN